MNRTMRRIILLAILIVAVLAVTACQRDRPAAEGENWVTPGTGSAVSPLGTAVAPAITSVVTSGTVLPGAQLTPGGFITGTLPTLAAVTGTATPGTNVVVVGPTYGYTVVSGDTLYSIALANGTDVDTIRLLNNLTSDALQVGQVLIVPGSGETGGSATAGATPTPATIYTVTTGDTLSGIADLFGITWEEIAAANDMQPPYVIYRGQRLVIPGVETMPTTPAAAGNSIKHVVQEGETLLGIAVQYGVTSQAIMQANGMTDPDFLTVGQELIIPQP